jgi:hypothetical protein
MLITQSNHFLAMISVITGLTLAVGDLAINTRPIMGVRSWGATTPAMNADLGAVSILWVEERR